MKKTIFAWHVHHDVLVESLTEPFKNRVAFIKKNKPKEEIPLRLKLFKKVKGKLPEEVIKAWEAYDKALQKHHKEIEALHKKECPNCPWDSKSIFRTRS